jgi:hypothetical protein
MLPSSLAARVTVRPPSRPVDPALSLRALAFRSRFASCLIERTQREQKKLWTHDDLGMLVLEVLEDDFAFDWSLPNAVGMLQDYFVLACATAREVLPAALRAI